jgi:hypothetical protein
MTRSEGCEPSPPCQFQRLPIVRENRPRRIKDVRSSIGQSIALARNLTVSLFPNRDIRSYRNYPRPCHAENAMRSLIAAVFSVAALLSVNSGAFSQRVQPQGVQPQAAQPQVAQPQATEPKPNAASSSEYSYEEHGRYHPCPSSVRFNGRNACLGYPARCRVLPSDLIVH